MEKSRKYYRSAQSYIVTAREAKSARKKSLEDIDQISMMPSIGGRFYQGKAHRAQWLDDLKELSDQAEVFHGPFNEENELDYEDAELETKVSDVSLSDKVRCMKFMNFESFAELFVDEIIELSVDVCEKLVESALCAEDAELMEKTCICNFTESVHTVPPMDPSESLPMEKSSLSAVAEKTTFSGWPTIKHFTIEGARRKILEFMDQWYFVEDWKYTVLYLTSFSDLVSDFHLYQGMWSIPTKEYPVAQATASIYFTIEVSRIKPKFCKVNVTLQFEGSSNTYRAGQFEFIEKWLFNIIDSKINLFKTLRF